MKAAFVQKSGAEIVSEYTSCISCCPMGAFSVAISDTHMILQIGDTQWRVPIADMAMFMKTYGEEIECDYLST